MGATDRNTGPVADFCAGLRDVQQRSTVDRTVLAGRLTISRSQLHAILNGDIKRPPEWDRFVAPFLRACGVDEQAISEWRRRHDVLVRVHEELRRQRRAAVSARRAGTAGDGTVPLGSGTVPLQGGAPPRTAASVAAGSPAVAQAAGSPAAAQAAGTQAAAQAAGGPAAGAARPVPVDRPPPAAPFRTVPATPADPALERAVDDLAGVVRRQWLEEIGARASQPHSLIPLRWLPSDRPGAGVPAAGPGAPASRPVGGKSNAIVDLLATLPARQLLLLGTPGAGKTFAAMACTLDLLAARRPGDPVPVLLTASSWNPLRERVDAWLSRRLVEEYPWLANAGTYGDNAANRLVATRRVMVVMDGLDEIPADQHGAAFKALDIYAGGEHPFLLTCRGDEYEHGVRRHGTVLARAVVVELAPLDPARARAYLCAGPVAGDTRWTPLLRHLDAHPDGPLALALSTPLMVDLARATYTPLTSDPSELMATGRFATREDIERHLVGHYLSAVYSVHHDRVAHQVGALPEPDPGTRYRYDDAVRWLSFLARHVRQPGAVGIAWWRMRLAMPRWPFQALLGLILGAVSGTTVGTAAGAVFGSPFRPVAGVAVGLGVAFGTALLAGPRAPVPARIDLRLPLRRLVGNLPWIVTVGLLSGLAFGAIFAATTGSRRGLVIGLGAGLVAGLTGAAGVSVGVALRAPLDPADDVSQGSLLRSDRRSTIVAALATAVLSGVTAAAAALAAARPERQLPVAFIAGLGVSIGAALVAVARSAWGQWLVARLWLTVTGRLPWAPMRFLDDAHRRGMLRRVGAVYEFRHRSVQEHLGGRSPGQDVDGADDRYQRALR